jgi:type VI secretion system protein ImpA
LRREADPTLDPGGETKHADWRGVAALCEAALVKKTKDLELAAAYTQAQTHLQGFPGLEGGLRLLTGLVANFWDHVFPGHDEGEVIEAIRARPLSWVGTAKDFLLAVRRIPLSAPIGETGRSWFDYEQAERVDRAGTKADQAGYKELIEAGYITSEAWHAALGATPPERVAATLSGLQACEEALAGLSAACDEKFRESPPYFTELSNLLDEMKTLLQQFVTSGTLATRTIDDGGQIAAEAVGAAGAAGAAGPSGPSGPITSRDEAYRRLREAAEYLRKTEPHSPVPSLVDRAVRWGNMTFENLFDDVVKNQDVRSQTKDLLGLQESGN